MIALTTFAGRNIAVFGLARSGLAAARALIVGGARVAAWDDGEAGREKARQAGISLVDLSTADWAGFDALVLAPGVPLTHPEPHWTVRKAAASGVEVIGDIELFFRERRARASRCKVVALTGTNGKSTTIALIGHLLREAGYKAMLGGNIGEAVLGQPDLADDHVYVLELSSYQIDLTPSIAPDAGGLLNISPDHLERHGTIENYAEIKSRLFANMAPEHLAVIGVDDPFCQAIAERLQQGAAPACPILPVSVTRKLDRGIYADGETLYEASGGDGVPIAFLSGIQTLRGRHNAQNAAMAWALARAIGADVRRLTQALHTFPGLVHRMEPVARRANVLFVNDSKATNADAAAHALSSYERIYWIAGGRAKDGGIEDLTGYAPRIAKAYLVGEATADFSATLAGLVETRDCGTIDKAVEAAAVDAAANSSPGHPAVVLLSPACASFDQFPDFEARGNAFKAAVARLPDIEILAAGTP